MQEKNKKKGNENKILMRTDLIQTEQHNMFSENSR